VRLAFPGLAEDARQLIGRPSLDLLVVAFAGLALRFLAGPAESLLEDFADVLGVVRDAEAFADEPGDAVGGPQFVVPAVFFGALQQEAFEFAEGVVGQPGRRAGDRSGVQAVAALRARRRQRWTEVSWTPRMRATVEGDSPWSTRSTARRRRRSSSAAVPMDLVLPY
jgi:hypothetical protein